LLLSNLSYIIEVSVIDSPFTHKSLPMSIEETKFTKVWYHLASINL